MKITVVGAGETGEKIISGLCNEGHDVTVMDTDSEQLEDIGNIYDVFPIVGNGTNIEDLETAGIEECDLFIAVTDSDEINMISCFLARQQGAKNTFARIRSHEYSGRSLGFLTSRLGINMNLNPEYESADDIFNIIQFPSAFKIETFSHRVFRMVDVKLRSDSPLDGMKIADLKRNSKYNFLICTVQRGNSICIPNGDYELKAGDKIGIAGTQSELFGLLKSLHLLRKEIKNVMILGAGITTFYLAKAITTQTKCDVTVIEKNHEKCEKLSKAIKDISVICGDPTDRELLFEEGIQKTDAVINLLDNDSENVLMGSYEKSLGIENVIVRVDHRDFSKIAEEIGIDSVISPQQTVTDIIIRNARAVSSTLDVPIERMYSLCDGTVEALEFKVGQDFPLLNVPIMDMKIRENVLIAGIIRNRNAIVPGGKDVIMSEDRVVVIASGMRLSQLSDILKRG